MKTHRILTALLLLLALVACPLLSACGGGGESESQTGGVEPFLDYLTLDFSKYVDFSRDKYTGHTVEVAPKAEITEQTVDMTVQEILFSHGNFSAEPITEGVTKVGDGLWIWISMYYEGQEILDLCNYTQRGEQMVVGDNQALYPNIPELTKEIEDACLGLDLSATRLEKKTGTVAEGDVIFVTFTAANSAEKKEGDDSLRVDLSDPALAAAFAGKVTAVYDERGFLQNADDCTAEVTLDGREGTARVEFILGEERYISFPVALSGNFRTAEGKIALDNAEVECHLIVNQCFAWETDEFDEDFILNVLKDPLYDEETGEALLGDALVERHREILRILLEAEAESLYLERRDAALRDLLEENFRVLEYPEAAIREFREPFIDEVMLAYERYQASGGYMYASLDAYAVAHLLNEYGIAAEGTLQEISLLYAKEQVKSLLMIYYVACNEGLVPEDEEIDLESYDVLEGYVAEQQEAGYDITEDDVLEYYGGWENFRLAVREEMVLDNVLDFLAEANTLVPPAAE